jgi:acyl-CoA thioesterase
VTAFAQLIRAVETVDGAAVVDLPDTWAQGRTAYGGLTAALCVEAARRADPDLPPLRSAQFAFAGPASGRLAATPTFVRRGRSATIVEVALSGEAGPATRALLTYGAARPSKIAHMRLARPSAPGPDGCGPHFIEGRAPRFAQNFDVRHAAGSRPLGGEPPSFIVWARHRDAAGVHPETAFVALADAPPPAAFMVFPEIGPISTMTWQIDLLAPTSPDAWLMIAAESDMAGDGYSAQTTSFWDPEGPAVAVARQTVALFV